MLPLAVAENAILPVHPVSISSGLFDLPYALRK
jgi:hypothetical protein